VLSSTKPPCGPNILILRRMDGVGMSSSSTSVEAAIECIEMRMKRKTKMVA